MLQLSNLPRFIFKSSYQACLGLSLFASSAIASGNRLNVVEMFTSQSCYSCPAADQLLHDKAAANENILNLEFHVDYWNKLRYGLAGVWVDPYSKAEYTHRQGQYAALNLRGNNGVYTPQAVVNGAYGLVGSDEYEFDRGLKHSAAQAVDVSVEASGDALLTIKINSGSTADANVYIVHFLRHIKTDVPTGENHGKLMENHNVVTNMRSLGSVAELAAKPKQIVYAVEENRGCAVIVQQPNLGPILGAARCR